MIIQPFICYKKDYIYTIEKKLISEKNTNYLLLESA